MKKTIKFIKTKKGIAIISALVIIIIFFVARGNKAPIYQFVTVEKGSITETVSVTGNSSPVESVVLGFGNSGTVSRIHSSIGKQVIKGQSLAELDTSDLSAQIKQADANLNTQKAKLAGLRAGSRPEDIASSQAALDKANQDLANLYATTEDISSDSYSKANDAIRVQLDPLFFNDETSYPAITYSSNYPLDQIVSGRAIATELLNKWNSETSKSTLLTLGQFASNTMKSLDNSLNLTATTLAGYKASATIAINEINTALKNINTLSQNISSQKLTITQLESQLALKKAGSTAEDILSQEAQVQSAEAALESIYAKLGNSKITSPINGIITQFDAKVGQLASSGTPLIAIISDSAFEVNALVSEIDIGKVSVNDTVSMTLDAFPGEKFSGTVYYVEPAETTSEGVVGYKIKIFFDKTDPRLKSGLTCNIDISTKHKENVLTLPQYAILQNDQGVFVQQLISNKIENIPIRLGISDQDGKVEIVSGVTVGQQVLNIGLKQK